MQLTIKHPFLCLPVVSHPKDTREGVQLGKVLAKRVLAHETDGALKVYSDLLNI